MVTENGYIEDNSIYDHIRLDFCKEGATILKYLERKSKLRQEHFTICLTHHIQMKNKIVLEMQTTELLNEGHQQDELSHATNWKRAFEKIYVRLKWLNAYAIINEIATRKILKKFMKEHFKLKDNILDKCL